MSVASLDCLRPPSRYAYISAKSCLLDPGVTFGIGESRYFSIFVVWNIAEVGTRKVAMQGDNLGSGLVDVIGKRGEVPKPPL